MFKLFRKKSNKKGFTLAEMLIVVAIIAILVAIAIPIFTNSLEKAHKAAQDANVRSVKAVAIYEILDNWDTYKEDAYEQAALSWSVEASISGGSGNTNGQITITAITPYSRKVPGNTLSYTTDTNGNIQIKGLDILSAEVNVSH